MSMEFTVDELLSITLANVLAQYTIQSILGETTPQQDQLFEMAVLRYVTLQREVGSVQDKITRVAAVRLYGTKYQ